MALIRPLALASALSTLAASYLGAQDTTNFPVIGSIEHFDDSFSDLVADDAEIEVIASGFGWAEGPAWSKEGKFLLFSDVHNNRVVKWTEGVGAETYLEPSGYSGYGKYSNGSGSNGLAFDHDGNLISCEHGDRRLSSMPVGQGKRTVVDAFEGKRFNSPNDLAISSSGAIYFTDPAYGMPKGWDDPAREIPFTGVFVRWPDGSVEVIDDSLAAPNGVDLSADERTLFVAQSDKEKPIIYSYPLDKAGRKTGKREVFFDLTPHRKLGEGNPDGLKTDQAGNVWTSGLSGVLVISPEGILLGHINTGERTANCAWGDDGSTLYLTSDMYLCRVKTKAKGRGF